MKILFINIVFILMFYSCRQSNNVVVEKWDTGSPKVVMKFKSVSDSTYTRIEYFGNGTIKSTQDFVHGKLNGKLISYFDKGVKQSEFDYVEGQKNGIGTEWYESGKIAYQFRFKDGLYYDGTEYFENGWPKVLVKFSAPGQREGKATYFQEDGHIWMEGYFKNGKEDSVWVKYDKVGGITERIKYKNGSEVTN